MSKICNSPSTLQAFVILSQFNDADFSSLKVSKLRCGLQKKVTNSHLLLENNPEEKKKYYFLYQYISLASTLSLE